MFSILLLALATGSAPDPVIVVEGRPTVSINVARYDLRQEQDVRGLEARIHGAADRVCIRGYPVAFYLERVACVKSAIAKGNQQLSRVAKGQSSAPLTAASNSISTK